MVGAHLVEGNAPKRGQYESDQRNTAAKHRFGSYPTPLSRVCKNLHRVIQLCHKISARNEAGQWATKILSTFTARKAMHIAGLCAGCCRHMHGLKNQVCGFRRFGYLGAECSSSTIRALICRHGLQRFDPSFRAEIH